MAAAPHKNPHTRAQMPAFGAFPANKASLLLEKSNPGLRRSTPDSEALASSDDEGDQTRATHAPSSSSKSTRPMRRTSWLTEMPSSNRKPSITMSGPYSPTTSHPATPSGEQAPFVSSASPVVGASGNWTSAAAPSYPWGGIWNSENRKEPPARLQEVLPSPTAIKPPTARFLADDGQQSPSLGKGSAGADELPFSFPLQPTPKTYRSQSYSVGQLELGANNPAAGPVSGPHEGGRGRIGGQYTGVQRRTSRNGGLGERGLETGGLDRVKEDEGDEESPKDAQGLDDFTSSQARMIEHLQRENARLRETAQSGERSAALASAKAPTSLPGSVRRKIRGGGGYDETDPAVDDFDEANALHKFPTYEGPDRRLGDQSTLYAERQHIAALDGRNSDNVKRGHWQTTLGFGSIEEPPQSRRHSFADVPTRQGSLSSAGDAATRPNLADRGVDQDQDDSGRIYGEDSPGYSQGERREFPSFHLSGPAHRPLQMEDLPNRHGAAGYFRANNDSRRAAESSIRQSYPVPDPYGRTSQFGSSNNPLYIVNFKCCRSEVFYIQDGTGLHVNPGDLVIVEADRGTDLGIVQHVNVTWDEARHYKEHYAEEHYKWLMMFSQQSKNGGTNAVNPNGLPGYGMPNSAVGGMGPQGQHGSHEMAQSELKPKMIRRLAQQHEIQTLKDKEGNEAKAKRTCQAKVVEHRLNMEILDAEFQLDCKKLTFYYFADTYINFNSLVTDLFKIYKTRIWMSAINPASFITPTSQLAMPPAFALPSMGQDRGSPVGRRRQHGLGLTHPSAPAYEDSFDNRQRPATNQSPGFQNQYFSPFQAMPANQQTTLGMQGYPMQMAPPVDPFAAYHAPPYPLLNPNAPNFSSSQARSPRNGRPNRSPGEDWSGKFQGLSLGS